jgi:hypothetical protein
MKPNVAYYETQFNSFHYYKVADYVDVLMHAVVTQIYERKFPWLVRSKGNQRRHSEMLFDKRNKYSIGTSKETSVRRQT